MTAINFSAGSVTGSALLPHKKLFASRREDKWAGGFVPAIDVPAGVALPPYIRIQSAAKHLVQGFVGEWAYSTNHDRISRSSDTTETLFIHTLRADYRTYVANPEIIWTSLNTEVAVVNQAGEMSYVSDGVVTIRAQIAGTSLVHEKELIVSSGIGGSVSEFAGFVEGSLAHHCENSINSRIQEASSALLPIFSTQNHAAATYVRNPVCWIYDIRQAATCISPWNSSGGVTLAGTLITPRHIIFAAHYEIAEGATVRFVTADNQTVTRTMIKRRRHPNYSSFFPDLTVGVLDSDVPETITPCRVLPPNWSQHLPTGPLHIATLGLDQEEKALVSDLSHFLNGFAHFRFPNQPYEQLLYEDKVGGDSGNPAFLIVNSQLVLLTVWTIGGPGIGTFVTPQIAAINQMIADVDASAGNGGTAYTLSTVDLSGFPSY